MERFNALISIFVLAAKLPYWHRCISVNNVYLNLNIFSNMTVYMKFRSTSTSSPQLFFTHYHVTRALYSNFLLYLNVTVPFFCHCENQKYYLKFVLTQGGWPKSSVRLRNHIRFLHLSTSLTSIPFHMQLLIQSLTKLPAKAAKK